MQTNLDSLFPLGFRENLTPEYLKKLEHYLEPIDPELFSPLKQKLAKTHEILTGDYSEAIKSQTKKELLQYVQSCSSIGQRKTNTLNHFDLLPPVLKRRLLSSLEKISRRSGLEALNFLVKAEQEIIKPAMLMLDLHGNHYSFNSSYSHIFRESQSLKMRWEQALEERDQEELIQIKELFSRLSASGDAEDVFTTKQIFKLLKKAMKRSVADLHQLATFHQLQSSKDRWIDADSLRSFKSDEIRSEKFRFQLQKKQGIDPESQLFTKHHINRCRYAEEMAFIRGIGEIAREEGATYAGHLTCTLPARFHHLKSGRPNPDYEYNTVKAGHEFLQEGWTKTRGFLSYHQKLKHFVKVFQPHESGVAHMHIVAFLNSKDHIRLFVKRIAKYLDQEKNWSIHWSPDEIEHAPGCNSDGTGIVFKMFPSTENDDAIQNALRYSLKSLKYSFANGSDYDEKDLEEIQAIQAWCATHNIRRYSSSVVGKTLWRDLRKLPDFGSEAQSAAKTGNYARFYRITQRDLTEALVQMPTSENPSMRIWAFAKKFLPGTDLVFVDFIELPPFAQSRVTEVDLRESGERLSPRHDIFTVISNNRESLPLQPEIKKLSFTQTLIDLGKAYLGMAIRTGFLAYESFKLGLSKILDQCFYK